MATLTELVNEVNELEMVVDELLEEVARIKLMLGEYVSEFGGLDDKRSSE